MSIEKKEREANAKLVTYFRDMWANEVKGLALQLQGLDAEKAWTPEEAEAISLMKEDIKNEMRQTGKSLREARAWLKSPALQRKSLPSMLQVKTRQVRVEGVPVTIVTQLHANYPFRGFVKPEEIKDKIPRDAKIIALELAGRERLHKNKQAHLEKEELVFAGPGQKLALVDAAVEPLKQKDIELNQKTVLEVLRARRELPDRTGPMSDQAREMLMANNVWALAKTQKKPIAVITHHGHGANIEEYLINREKLIRHMKSVGRAGKGGIMIPVGPHQQTIWAHAKWEGFELIDPITRKRIRPQKRRAR
ncbi:MAG TPA: hypothetical protein VJA40_04035 [archaeon]|nr:hypothetical protein [archaeon]